MRLAPASVSQPPSHRALYWIELGFIILFLILFSEGLVQRLVTGEEDVDGNIILRIMWLPVYGVVALMALMRFRDMLALALRTPFLILVILLAAASFTWSIDPGLSLRRGISVAMTSVFGLYLAVRFSWRDLLILLGSVWAGLTLLSFGAGLLTPSFARDFEIHAGAWRGFWFEKNTLGGHMSRVGFLFAFLFLIDAPRRWLWAGAFGLASLLVILSTSATALLGLMAGLAVLAGGVLIQGAPVRAVALIYTGLCAGVAFIAALVMAPEFFLGLIGKDPTLTGRTDIWSALTDVIAARPWLGYGYGAFWAPDSDVANWVRVSLQWAAPTAHNGWLDAMLSVGLIGAAAFGVSYAATLWRMLGLILDHRFGLYAAGLLIQFFLFSMSESIVLEQNSLVWIGYVSLAGLLARGLGREERLEQTRPARSSGPRFDLRRGAIF